MFTIPDWAQIAFWRTNLGIFIQHTTYTWGCLLAQKWEQNMFFGKWCHLLMIYGLYLNTLDQSWWRQHFLASAIVFAKEHGHVEYDNLYQPFTVAPITECKVACHWRCTSSNYIQHPAFTLLLVSLGIIFRQFLYILATLRLQEIGHRWLQIDLSLRRVLVSIKKKLGVWLAFLLLI